MWEIQTTSLGMMTVLGHPNHGMMKLNFGILMAAAEKKVLSMKKSAILRQWFGPGPQKLDLEERGHLMATKYMSLHNIIQVSTFITLHRQ